MKKNERRLADAGDERKDEDQKNSDKIMELTNSVQILENRALRFEATSMEEYRKLQTTLETDDRFAAIHERDSGMGR